MVEIGSKKGNQFEGKEKYVKDVFTEIADDYDEMNDVMSLRMIHSWHKFMIKKAGDIYGKKCLDIGTGTGEIAFQIAKEAGPFSTIIAVDITPHMLEVAKKKETRLNLPVKIDWRIGDALKLDIPDNSIDLVTSGYMLRNVTDISKALSEMYRVVVPGGKVVVAELSKPKNRILLLGYDMYMKRVRKCGHDHDRGKVIDGRQPAYEWLESSIEGFPYGEDMIKIFEESGFVDTKCYTKSMGAVSIYTATKQ
ncbi:MAG: ubiquinone/menaquinone biosynthesis methyltransferase [archaeon]|nr:ubiquinone/menaquinone biosynthesis methyltransferase [archaeon]